MVYYILEQFIFEAWLRLGRPPTLLRHVVNVAVYSSVGFKLSLVFPLQSSCDFGYV